VLDSRHTKARAKCPPGPGGGSRPPLAIVEGARYRATYAPAFRARADYLKIVTTSAASENSALARLSPFSAVGLSGSAAWPIMSIKSFSPAPMR
jgi:hypothetical protein